MKLLLTLILAVTALSVIPAGQAGAAERETIHLDHVKVKLREGTRQVVSVNRTTGSHARVTFWRRGKDGWQKAFRSKDGRIGYNGLVRPRKRKQGSGKTPAGTFRLPWAFGMHKRKDTWDLRYRKVRKGDYWVLDNESAYYNRYRNKSKGGFRWRLDPGHPDASERLKDYPTQYEYSIVTSFNKSQVKHRGGAIFLHVNGSGATAGCVSAPRWFLRRLMRRLDPDRVPVIAIGG